MANVMIECPQTGRPIRTGIDVDDESFRLLKLRDNVIGCPVCGEIHEYRKEEAFLAS